MSLNYPNQVTSLTVIDFEFSTDGGSVSPISYVARVQDFDSIDRKPAYIYGWKPKVGSMEPYGTGDKDLLVTFFGEAEYWLMSHLGWKLPKNHFDCYVENRNLFNGILPKQPKKLWGLEETIKRFKLKTDHKEDDKSDLRVRLGTGDFKESEKDDILRYNKADVVATYKLYHELLDVIREDPTIEDKDLYFRQALLRGRQVAAIGKMINTGLPVDRANVVNIKNNLEKITEHFITKANKDLRVWDGTRLSMDKFKKLLEREKLLPIWPTTPTGAVKTDKKTLEKFEDNNKIFQFQTVQSFRRATKLNDFPLQKNAPRASCYLSMFNNITARAGPATSKYMLNMSGAFRPLIQANEGWTIIERDWEQQEFLIGAVLSGDEAMLDAYMSGDPYLSLGIQAGSIPKNATKDHPKRGIFKTVCLQLQYGSGTQAIADRLRCTYEEADLFVSMHKRIFSKFWQWSNDVVNHALASWKLETKFGWQYQLEFGAEPRGPLQEEGFSLNTLRNWPCQSAGCEMLRLALMYASEEGLEVVATVHDCLIIHAPIKSAEIADKLLIHCMDRASKDIIGVKCRTELKKYDHPMKFEPKDPRHYEIYMQMMEVSNGFA